MLLINWARFLPLVAFDSKELVKDKKHVNIDPERICRLPEILNFDQSCY